MDDLHCQACHRQIPPGSLFYCCRTEIISGFDGILPEVEIDPDLIIQEACEEITAHSPQELLHEVYQEIKMVLCPACRLELRKKILSMTNRRKPGGKILPFTKTRPE